jgi:hypothetical protein
MILLSASLGSNWIERNEKYFGMFAGAILFACSLITALIVHHGQFESILRHPSDPLGYYQFLPAVFLEHDIRSLPWVHILPDGSKLSIFTIGVAILQAPFFLLGHLAAWILDAQLDGFSAPYATAQQIGASIYLGAAAMLLYTVLRRMYSSVVALAVLLMLYLGTNLFYYTSFESGMSHVYSFFLFSSLLHLTDRYVHGDRSILHWCIPLGALIVLVRPLNVFILLIPLLYKAGSFNDVLERIKDIFFKRRSVMMIALALLIILPQMMYWYAITGDPILFTYGAKGESFDFSAPHLFEIFFSHQNGWFIYTPLMLPVMLRLLWDVRLKHHGSRTILLYFTIAWYFYASWWAWWLGGAFGYRGFIEYYALLAIPLAGLINDLLRSKRIARLAGIFFVCLMIYFNLRLSFLYQPPWDGPEWNWEKVQEVYKAALSLR